MRTTDTPDRCQLCGYYLTTAAQFAGYCCVNPDHWQAVGLLAPRDYYAIAKIAARARLERNQRRANGNTRSRQIAAESKVGPEMMEGRMKGGGAVYDCLKKSP